MEMDLSSNITTSLNKTNNTPGHDCTDFFLIMSLISGIINIPCACIGVLASVWLLWVLVQRQRTGLSNDIYMLSLTIMDLIFNIMIFSGTIDSFFGKNATSTVIMTILYSFNIAGRPLFMACICVDCYMAVVYPVTYMNLKHSKHRFVSSVFVFALTLCYGMCLAFKRYIFTTTLPVIPYALSLPIIAFCDVAILRTLRQPDPSGRREVHPQKQRALQAVSNSLVMTVVAYLPPLIAHAFSPLIGQEMLCFTFIPCLLFPVLGSTLMPLLYLQNLGKLKGWSMNVLHV